MNHAIISHYSSRSISLNWFCSNWEIFVFKLNVSAENVKNCYKNQAHIFSACLLAMFLNGQPYFYLMVGWADLMYLIVETFSYQESVNYKWDFSWLVKMINLTIFLKCWNIYNDF